MKRDYAKKNIKSYRASSPWRLWLSTAILFVCFTLGLVYWGKRHYTAPLPPSPTASVVKEKKIKANTPAKPHKQPHFDFYTTRAT